MSPASAAVVVILHHGDERRVVSGSGPGAAIQAQGFPGERGVHVEASGIILIDS